MFSVGQDHVTEARRRAELLSQQFDVLREHISAFLQEQVAVQGQKQESQAQQQQTFKPTSTFSGLAGFFSSRSFIRGLSWYTSARLILQHPTYEYNSRDHTGGNSVFTCS